MRVPTQVTSISVHAHNCIGLLYKLWARPLIRWIKAHSRGHGAAACAGEDAAGSVCVRAALPPTWWASFSSTPPCSVPPHMIRWHRDIQFPSPFLTSLSGHLRTAALLIHLVSSLKDTCGTRQPRAHSIPPSAVPRCAIKLSANGWRRPGDTKASFVDNFNVIIQILAVIRVRSCSVIYSHNSRSCLQTDHYFLRFIYYAI